MSQDPTSGESARTLAEPGPAVRMPMNAASMDLALARNRDFAAARGHEGVVMFPITTFVITCIDPRVDPAHILGIGLGEAIIVRNGGGRVTVETIETVAFIAQVVEEFAPNGVGFEIAVIHHTECGAAFLADDRFRQRYAERIGAESTALLELAVVDPISTVIADVDKLRASASIFPAARVSGHVYDLSSGVVETVVPATNGTTVATQGE